jgi:hypothetical protein
MSTMEYKVVLRVIDENISSEREHLEYMRRITGEEPRWVEGEDSEDDMPFHFSYQPLTEDGRRVHHTSKDKPFFMDVAHDGLYGVDLVLAWTLDEPPSVAFDYWAFQGHLQTIANATGLDAEHVTFLSYGWYNGVDEPIQWS